MYLMCFTSLFMPYFPTASLFVVIFVFGYLKELNIRIRHFRLNSKKHSSTVGQGSHWRWDWECWWV